MTPPLPPMTDADVAAARELADAALTTGIASVADRTRSYELMERLAAEVERLRAEQLRADCDALTMPAALAEIDRLRSQLRARELTDEERETLREVRAEIAEFGMAVDDGTDDVSARRRALAVLDKLLKETP